MFRLMKGLILDNINFKINEGQIFGLLGPNGVGKSGILILTGLINQKMEKLQLSMKMLLFPIT